MLASHNTFGGVLNISDVISKKSTLRKVNETVFTRHDGSRYTQNNIDGTYSDLPASSRDADGQWAILDESSPSPEISRNESESKSKEIDSSFQNETENKTKPISESESVLVNILKQHPELSQYLIFLKVGVPISTIKSKMTHEGVDIKLPKEILESFYRALDNGNGNNNTSSSDIEESDNKEPNEININELNEAIGESKDIYHKESSPLGKPMKGNYYEIHGHLAKSNWDHPILASYSNTPARAGYNTEMGHEYLDSPKVLKEKVKLLAQILLKAKKTVIYAGAGLSTASGIGDYATQTGKSGVLAQSGHKGANISPFCVKPNFGHHCITALSKKGLIHKFVQQNHDGLPQKAGFPQELLNEIHGSWFNPSNPVVKYSGTLYEPCYESMLDDASNADLIIVLGTSLGGLNADQVAIRTAERSLQLNHDGGTVCINLQQTPQDDKMTLRMFGKSDDILIHLLKELNINHDIKNDIKHNPASRGNSNSNSGAGGGSLNRSTPHWPTESRILIPYDKHGNLLKSFKLLKQEQQLKDGDQFNPTDRSAYQSILEKYHENNEQNHEKWMWLDLRNGSDIKLVSGHNCVGSGQPNFAKITHGRGTVVKRNDACCAFNLTIQGASMKLGLWWMDSALRGAVELLPVVNHNPEYQFPTINNNNSASEEKKNKKPSSSTVQRSPQNVRMSSRLSKK